MFRPTHFTRIQSTTLAENTASKGEITRGRHFYSDPASKRGPLIEYSLSNLVCNYSFNCRPVRRGVFSHKFNAGCGASARVRGNEVRSWRDLLDRSPLPRIHWIFSTARIFVNFLLAARAFTDIFSFHRDHRETILLVFIGVIQVSEYLYFLDNDRSQK